MKKFLVVMVVLAFVGMGTMAFAAADVSVGGSVQIRSRDFNNLISTKICMITRSILKSASS